MKLITMGQCKAKSIMDFKKQLHSGRKITKTIKHKGLVITSHLPDIAGNCTEKYHSRDPYCLTYSFSIHNWPPVERVYWHR